jgi:hypothetical protein
MLRFAIRYWKLSNFLSQHYSERSPFYRLLDFVRRKVLPLHMYACICTYFSKWTIVLPIKFYTYMLMQPTWCSSKYQKSPRMKTCNTLAWTTHQPQEEKTRVRIPPGCTFLWKRSNAVLFNWLNTFIVCVLKKLNSLAHKLFRKKCNTFKWCATQAWKTVFFLLNKKRERKAFWWNAFSDCPRRVVLLIWFHKCKTNSNHIVYFLRTKWFWEGEMGLPWTESGWPDWADFRPVCDC